MTQLEYELKQRMVGVDGMHTMSRQPLGIPHSCNLYDKPYPCGSTVIGEQMHSGEDGPGSGTGSFTRRKEAHCIQRHTPLKRKLTSELLQFNISATQLANDSAEIIILF